MYGLILCELAKLINLLVLEDFYGIFYEQNCITASQGSSALSSLIVLALCVQWLTLLA